MAQTWKGTFAAMLAGGAIGVALAPIIAPAVSRMTGPALKAALKAGVLIYARSREVTAELRERVEDATAEVRMELAREQAAAAAATTDLHESVH
jgi:hypothetical protein